MNNYEKSKSWSDKFIIQIKRSLGEVFIIEATHEDDTEFNTDLLMPNGDRIACRIRRHTYWEKYRDQFTIRTERPSGMKSELEKILEGWGDYIFYGFSNPDETGLTQWFIGNLDAFRVYLKNYMEQNEGQLPGIEHNNRDGSSSFRAFNLQDIPNFIRSSMD